MNGTQKTALANRMIGRTLDRVLEMVWGSGFVVRVTNCDGFSYTPSKSIRQHECCIHIESGVVVYADWMSSDLVWMMSSDPEDVPGELDAIALDIYNSMGGDIHHVRVPQGLVGSKYMDQINAAAEKYKLAEEVVWPLFSAAMARARRSLLIKQCMAEIGK